MGSPTLLPLSQVERNGSDLSASQRAFGKIFVRDLVLPLQSPHRSPTPAADATRKHWGIENGLHYVRDVTLREDASRIRTNPGIFARLRSFAYNILRFNQRGTFAQDRYAAALGGFDALAAMRLCQQN